MFCKWNEMVTAPAFWKDRKSPWTRILSPFGALYGAVAGLHARFSKPKGIDIPVICVGNLVVGGAGKTPVALALAKTLKEGGMKVHFLSRGYRGNLKGPVLVDPHKHTYCDVGDEPLLLAKEAPTWVSRDRFAGAQAAIAGGAEIIIMDDGHQNHTLTKDISFIVVDGAYGFGNERVFPAGPLRESMPEGLRRAQAMIIIGKDIHALEARYQSLLPILKAQIIPKDINRFKNGPLFAFAGLGRPEKFFETLTHHGCKLAGTKAFPDHHAYRESELEELVMLAKGAQLVTTAKDWVRVPKAYQDKVDILEIEVTENSSPLMKDVLKVIERVKGHLN